MKKRGIKAQVTVFIIIAVFLAVIIYFAFSISKTSREEFLKTSFWSKLGIKTDVDKAKNYLSECMGMNTKEALKVIGIQGGYYKKPAYYSDLGWAFIPYYYKQGLFLMPTKEEVENQLSMYVDDKFVSCLDDLGFKTSNVEYSSSKTKASISQGQVVFKIDMPVAIKKEKETTTIELKDSPVIYNSSLYDILTVADYVTKSHVENETMVCINCLVQMAKEKSLYVDILNYPRAEASTLVMISENYTSSQPYLFEFLNRY